MSRRCIINCIFIAMVMVIILLYTMAGIDGHLMMETVIFTVLCDIATQLATDKL